eukprot:5052771-Amphidinium_carterae.1
MASHGIHPGSLVNVFSHAGMVDLLDVSCFATEVWKTKILSLPGDVRDKLRQLLKDARWCQVPVSRTEIAQVRESGRLAEWAESFTGCHKIETPPVFRAVQRTLELLCSLGGLRQ